MQKKSLVSNESLEKTLGQAEHSTVESSNYETIASGGSPTAATTVGFPFLSPAQSADELGRLGDYRILKLLGEGGMGFVFRGEDLALHRSVAIKVMRPEIASRPQSSERFLREGRAAASLNNDHIITIYQVGQANGVPFLAMEFLEGLPLDAWFRLQKGAIPLSSVLKIARDVLRGLAAAHDKGLIHRDIKPANLWIEKGKSRIKLLDFGLTRSQDNSDQMTVQGAVVGTPAFMAPEQAGGLSVDLRADLFAVGSILYLLLTGKNAFARQSLMGTLNAVCSEKQPSVNSIRADVPQEFSAYVDRLLSKDPNGRPAHAKAALEELAAIERLLKQSASADSTSKVTSTPEASPELAVAQPFPNKRTSVKVKETPRKPPNKFILVGGALFGFLALVLGTIIVITITNKDGSKTRIELPEGSKVELSESVPGRDEPMPSATKKSDSERVARPAPRGSSDPDRAVAEWVFSLPVGTGDRGFVGMGERILNEANQIPQEPFQLTVVDLKGNPIAEEDIDRLQSLRGLTTLRLNGPITNEGLKKLATFPFAKNLKVLGLGNNQLTDDGLELLTEFPHLSQLWLSTSRLITGTGFAKIIDKVSLAGLDLSESPNLSDEGLRQIGKMNLSEFLWLQGCGALTDSGIAHLESQSALKVFLYGQNTNLTRESVKSVSKMKSLNRLQIAIQLNISDADLAPLLALDSLKQLEIICKPITDAGLEPFIGLKNLKSLYLQETKVTLDGVKRFREARKDVEVTGDIVGMNEQP